MKAPNISPKISGKQSAAYLAYLGDQLFSRDFNPRMLINHASYIREASAKTLACFRKFLTGESLVIFWIQSAFLGLAIIIRDCWKLPSFRASGLHGDASRYDVLIVSHLTSITQLDHEDDPYFADLVQRYGQQWGGACRLLLNQVRAPIRPKHLHQGRLIETGRFRFFEGCYAWFGNLRQSLTFIWQSLWLTKTDEKRYLRFLACTQLDHHTMANARIVKRITKAVKRTQPKIVVITFEGYSWERAVTEQLHRENPNIKVLGYQHAVISGGVRAINKKFSSGIDPDHIFAAGEIMTKRLLKEGKFKASHFTYIGSPKARSLNTSKIGNALVAIPEGTLSETVMLAECLCEIARKMPDTLCLLRTHPVLKWQDTYRHISGWDNKLSNLHLSDNSLEEDITHAGWVLYRGSSVVINALLAGRRPMYFDADGASETTDILPAEVEWRKICKSSSDVIAIIKSDRQTGWQDDQEMRSAAQDFAQRYYTPLDYKKFEKVIRGYLTK